MATKTQKYKFLRFIENTFGVLGYVYSGAIAVFVAALALYYVLAIIGYASPSLVQVPIDQGETGLATTSPQGIILVAFAMIVTFIVLIVTGFTLIRALRWFIRTYSAGLHSLTKLLFGKYSARQFVLVKALVFAVEAGLLLGIYMLYPSVLLFTFLLCSALLLVASLLCIAAQAIVVLTTRRAPRDIL